jgi:hypothetical protein
MRWSRVIFGISVLCMCWELVSVVKTWESSSRIPYAKVLEMLIAVGCICLAARFAERRMR